MASRVPGSVSNRADLVCDTHRHLHNIQQEFKHRLHLSHYHAILKWYLSIRIDVGGIVSELQEVISANSALLQYLTVFALLSSRQHQKAAKPNLRLYVGKWELPHCQWKKSDSVSMKSIWLSLCSSLKVLCSTFWNSLIQTFPQNTNSLLNPPACLHACLRVSLKLRQGQRGSVIRHYFPRQRQRGECMFLISSRVPFCSSVGAQRLQARLLRASPSLLLRRRQSTCKGGGACSTSGHTRMHTQ